LDSARGRSLDARRRRAVLLQVAAQRHAEARGLGGREELFGIRSLAFFKARRKVVRTAEACLALERSVAGLEAAAPYCTCIPCWHVPDRVQGLGCGVQGTTPASLRHRDTFANYKNVSTNPPGIARIPYGAQAHRSRKRFTRSRPQHWRRADR